MATKSAKEEVKNRLGYTEVDPRSTGAAATLSKTQGAKTMGSSTQPSSQTPRYPATEAGFQARFNEDLEYTGGMGRNLGGMYAEGVSEDPRQAFATTQQAALDEFKDQFRGNLRQLRHSQVGSGRVDTGFGYADEDALFRALGKDFSRATAERALDAEAINQDRLRWLGSIGYDYNRDAIDASSGAWQTIRQQRMADKANRRSFWGRVLGGVLTAGGAVAGAILGGPPGAAAGASAGASAGRAVG